MNAHAKHPVGAACRKDDESPTACMMHSCCLPGVGDGTVAVWDVRKLKQDVKPVASAGHNYSCQAAVFAPDGERA